MATLLTKANLKNLLINMPLDYVDDSDAPVVEAWVNLWSEFFSPASLSSTTAYVPDSVADMTTYIKIGVNSLLGAGDASGSNVSVVYITNGGAGVFISEFSSVNYISTEDLMGQETVDTDVNNYRILTQLTTTNMAALQAAMSSSLAGISGTNAFASKLAAGISSWWTTMEGSPSDYFPSATAVTKPSGVSSGLESTIQSAIDYNNAYIAANDTISTEDAMDKLAEEIFNANSGGYATIGGSDYTIG